MNFKNIIGYLEQGLLLRDCKKLATNYLKSFQFKLDIFSIIPIDIIFIFYMSDYRTRFRFNRLIRVNRLFECRLKIETRTSYPFLFRICYLVLIIIVMIHCNACLYYIISKHIGFNSDDWVLHFESDARDFFNEYISCFFWSTMMLTTIGEVESPDNTAESAVMIITFLLAIVVVATLVGNIGSVISNMTIEKDKFQRRVDAIKSLMTIRKVSKELDKRVVKWFDYLNKSNHQSLNEIEILANLPQKLCIEIASYVHLETLKKVNIFSDCEEGLLKELVTKLKLQVYSPGDFVCKKGDIGKEMYIIEKGSLNVVSDDGKTIFVTLKAGAFFGEISILNIPGNKNGNRRTANVRSVGYSDLLRLTKNDLWEVLEDYPANKQMIIEKGTEKLRKDNLLEEIKKDPVTYLVEGAEPNKNVEFFRKPPEEKLKLLETKHQELEERFNMIVSNFNEYRESIKSKLSGISELNNRKIGIRV